MCTNGLTNIECQFLTQGTSCIGPASFKCQCQPGKYFNKEKGHYKCETLLEFNQSCLQGDSCRNSFCIGTPLICNCLPFQHFDEISSQCQNQLNTNASSSTITTTPSISTTTKTITTNSNLSIILTITTLSTTESSTSSSTNLSITCTTQSTICSYNETQG